MSYTITMVILLPDRATVTKYSTILLSLASRLNGYMYSNGKSLNVALFIPGKMVICILMVKVLMWLFSF